MLKINGNDITLTRGDSMRILLSLNKDGAIFTPSENDIIKFGVSKVAKGKSGYVLLISKTIDNATLLISLDPRDTETLDYGTYKYDLQITYENGDIDTFLEGRFNLTEEVS